MVSATAEIIYFTLCGIYISICITAIGYILTTIRRAKQAKRARRTAQVEQELSELLRDFDIAMSGDMLDNMSYCLEQYEDLCIQEFGNLEATPNHHHHAMQTMHDMIEATFKYLCGRY